MSRPSSPAAPVLKTPVDDVVAGELGVCDNCGTVMHFDLNDTRTWAPCQECRHPVANPVMART